MGLAALVALLWSAMLAHDHAAHAAVWHVPLERHDAKATASRAFSSALRLMETTKRASVWEPDFVPQDLGDYDATTKHDPVPVDFRDISMNMFAAKLSIGTPSQLVSLELDMGGSDILVFNHAVGHHLFYDHAKSSTYQANGTQVKMFEGQPFEIDGFVSRDHVALGNADGSQHIEVRDQLFLELTGPDKMLSLYPSKLDGFVGIGPGRANSTGATSLVRTMIDQQLLDSPEVGLSFGEVVAHAIFGGVDAAYSHTDFHYFTQKANDPWSAPVSAILVEGKQVLGDVGAAFFSNIDVVFGPGDQVDALADAVGAENYAMPCDGPGPNITFQLGDGFQVTLTKQDYAIPQDHGWCMFGIIPVRVSHWGLGLPFLRKVYTVLDYGAAKGEQRIGFAPIKP